MNIVTPNLNIPNQLAAESVKNGKGTGLFLGLLLFGTVVFLGYTYLKENDIKLFNVKKPINNANFP